MTLLDSNPPRPRKKDRFWHRLPPPYPRGLRKNQMCFFLLFSFSLLHSTRENVSESNSVRLKARRNCVPLRKEGEDEEEEEEDFPPQLCFCVLRNKKDEYIHDVRLVVFFLFCSFLDGVLSYFFISVFLAFVGYIHALPRTFRVLFSVPLVFVVPNVAHTVLWT